MIVQVQQLTQSVTINGEKTFFVSFYRLPQVCFEREISFHTSGFGVEKSYFCVKNLLSKEREFVHQVGMKTLFSKKPSCCLKKRPKGKKKCWDIANCFTLAFCDLHSVQFRFTYSVFSSCSGRVEV